MIHPDIHATLVSQVTAERIAAAEQARLLSRPRRSTGLRTRCGDALVRLGTRLAGPAVATPNTTRRPAVKLAR